MKAVVLLVLVSLISCKRGAQDEPEAQPAPRASQHEAGEEATPPAAQNEGAQAGADRKEKEAAAAAAAEKWLALVDEGRYSDSWDEAAGFFKGAVTREQWQQSLSGVRKPLGKALERRLSSSQYAVQLPGAPDGQYVVIQFDTSFENKKSAVETVTPMMDEDGRWRVSGYFIK